MTQETIKTLISVLRDESGYKETELRMEPVYTIDADAGRMIADALEKTLWVPCEERLPEEDGVYFVFGSNNAVVSAWWWGDGNECAYPNSWEMECTTSKAIGDKIIAWMPIPEPYKIP